MLAGLEEMLRALFLIVVLTLAWLATGSPEDAWKAIGHQPAAPDPLRGYDSLQLVAAGVVGGLVLGWILRVPWTRLPSLAVEWLLSKRKVFKWTGWALVCIAVIMLY